MRILIVRNYPDYMDVNNNTYNIQEIGLAKALIKQGHQCDVLFWTNKDEKEVLVDVIEEKKIIVYYRHAITFLKNALFLKCKDLFETYDVIQASEYNQLGSVWLSAKYPGKTIIYHGPYFSRFNKRYNLMCYFFDLFLLNNYINKRTRFITKSNLAKKFLAAKGINENFVNCVGVGVDSDMLSTGGCPNKSLTYTKMSNDTNCFKLLYVGKLERRRDIIYLLNILKEIHTLRPNVRLYMVGAGERQYVDKIFCHAEKIGVKDIIFWEKTLMQNELGGVYEQADVFILPTEYEIFGMVMLEAMLYKTVVLTTLNGGSDTLIKNGVNGFIIDKERKGAWINCLKDLIDNKQLLDKIKNNAAETICSNYTWDCLSDLFIQNYERLR